VHRLLIDRVKAKGFTAYGLAKAVKEAGGTMSEQAVRNFMNGANVRINNLGPLLKVLGLEIRPKE
jgi:hypothetical protein